MKRIAIIAAAASAGAFAASAGEMVAFTDIDANGDGVVTEAEFVTYKTADGEYTEEEASEKFVKIDANADGSVSEAELTSAMAEWKDKDVEADVDVDLETDTDSSY
ncbi:EF-hand domain-containing protein [Henriciella sp.]|uniref:EF-hand domain-containing protein n=1 Tax=Henriciella sp. TaxID=1968823 RepID=UPI0026252F67|nr:EF-hand domain-containing protein [Henriciella sp.]